MNGAPWISLLAQVRPNDAERNFGNESPRPGLGNLLMVLAIVAGSAAFFGGWQIFRRKRDHSRRHNNPRALFRALCHVHRLSWSERKTLREIAKEAGAAHEAEVFLRPELFDATANSAGGIAPAARKAIAQKLFGDAA